jgi:hypothetical protein
MENVPAGMYTWGMPSTGEMRTVRFVSLGRGSGEVEVDAGKRSGDEAGGGEVFSRGTVLTGGMEAGR